MIFKVKNKLYLVAFILIMGIFSSCSNVNVENNKEDSITNTVASYREISPEEAKERLNNEEEIILLDVRTQEEYDLGHIKNSILIPVDNLKDDAEAELKDKEANIFIYCRSGNRSKTAAEILVDLGYENVYDLGGINNWPYEIVK